MRVDQSQAREGVRSEVGNIAAIEGLRGVAVLWVLLFHYVSVRGEKYADPLIALIDSTRASSALAHFGFLGVDLFFLITGFLLTLPWFKHAADGRPAPSVGEFYLRRARRILPAYYVQLALLFFVFAPLLQPGVWGKATRYMVDNLMLHIGFLHYMTPYSSASLTLNGPLWTLALEMQYYLILPLLALAFVRRPWISACVLFAITAAWRLLAASDMEPLIAVYRDIGRPWGVPDASLRQLATTQLPGYLGHFAFGIICGRAWLLSRGRDPGPREKWLLAALFAAAVGALYVLLYIGFPVQGDKTWFAVPALMAIAMWAAVSRRPPWAKRVLGTVSLAFVGRISYSMYLYHLPVLLLFDKYVGAGIGFAAFPIYFAAILAVSMLSFRYVERQGPLLPGATAIASSAVSRGRA
jgi:peptidoglycan/LPS O-acetylase OafA/YrhL